eukprot:SAG31_NODE_1779_length_7293_cov_39.850153_8_plen_112_part_00
MADWIRRCDYDPPHAAGGTTGGGSAGMLQPAPERRSSVQLNPPAGGLEVKTLGDHLAKALASVQRDFWLEEWLATNTPDPTVTQPSGRHSPGSTDVGCAMRNMLSFLQAPQ